jgi:hypothetical protein
VPVEPSLQPLPGQGGPHHEQRQDDPPRDPCVGQEGHQADGRQDEQQEHLAELVAELVHGFALIRTTARLWWPSPRTTTHRGVQEHPGQVGVNP